MANVMWMGIYSLWTTWTPLYLQRVHHLTLGQTAAYGWVPPLASTAGGFLGGFLALRSIQKGVNAIQARIRVIFFSALGCLFTLLVPYAPGPAWGVAAISFSFFWTLAGSVNVYTLPIDLYGAQSAGRAISALVFAYGILQTVISPVIGSMVKAFRFRTGLLDGSFSAATCVGFPPVHPCRKIKVPYRKCLRSAARASRPWC